MESRPLEKTDLILGLDPGRDKCGLAVLNASLEVHWREISTASTTLGRIQSLVTQFQPKLLVMGNQTTAKEWQAQLAALCPQLPLELVDEHYSSQEARRRYWDFHRPQGLTGLLPLGMRVPPHPYDDIVAVILVERFLAAQGLMKR